MTREIVYDLSEVFEASTGKLRYYGIVRVVAEVGAHLLRLDPTIRFCIHSAAHDAFFEVFPTLDHDGSVALNVPSGVRQKRLRSRFYKPNPLRDVLAALARGVVMARNRRAWDEAGIELPRIDMSGKIYVHCGRPKLIVEAIGTLRRRASDVRIVPYVHDLIPLHDHVEGRRKDYPLNFMGDTGFALSDAALVLANSEFTRRELIEFSAKGLLPSPPAVVAVPLVHECPEGAEPAEQAPPAAPFLLAVGSATGRKNLEVVFDAMLVLHERGAIVPGLCLAGAPRKRTRDFYEQPRYAPIRDRIIEVANPNQTDLVALYRAALALVIPSRIEGWGLPAGEALWLGTPAICSDVPVLHEVCGDLGLYFGPDAPDALADHVMLLLDNPQFAEQLRGRIRDARPQLRDWFRVAGDMLAALKPLC
ncbi:MAG: glycosyltransferase family 4 protein [Sphingomonadales bacterium]|nr:glycosyltransferase family 4 protein [Sphingomonadales bacterium]